MSKAGSKHHPAMEIRISGLNDGEYPFSFDVPAGEIGLGEMFVGNVEVAGTLRKVSTQFFLTGTVRAGYVGECDRCLGEVRRQMTIPIKLFYGPDLGEGSASGEDNDEETRTIGVEQESIVLDEEVRQTIMLDMPLKILCSEGCLGICSGCGADLNKERCTCEGEEIDPRWAKLADVFKKKDE
jgi:uncharacterized protein